MTRDSHSSPMTNDNDLLRRLLGPDCTSANEPSATDEATYWSESLREVRALRQSAPGSIGTSTFSGVIDGGRERRDRKGGAR